MNGDKNESFRSICNDNKNIKNEQVDDRGFERPDQGSEVLQVVSGRATGDTGELTAQVERPPKNTDQLKERLMKTDRKHWGEIWYSYRLHKFEKEQIRLGLRMPPSRHVQSPFKNTANRAIGFKSTNFPGKHSVVKQQRILKSVGRGGRYTTSMIARNTGLSVSYVAPQLNILFKEGLVDRVSENQPPFIGALGGKKTVRHVYFKKEKDE